LPDLSAIMGIVISEHNETGGEILHAARMIKNGPCFEHGPFFMRFRKGARGGK